jgi:hypothetical protein
LDRFDLMPGNRSFPILKGWKKEIRGRPGHGLKVMDFESVSCTSRL